MFDEADWYVVSESDTQLALVGVAMSASPEAPEYTYASLRRQGDHWVPDGWGGCRIEIAAPGWGNARFVLDPDTEPDPGSATVNVLAWEMECASGAAPEGREVKPVTSCQGERA